MWTVATFELPKDFASAEYENGAIALGLNITKVTDGELDSTFNVGDSVTVTWFDIDNREQTFPAEFIGTMSVTVSGQTRVFMVLKDTSLSDTYHYVVGLPAASAPSKIIETGISANVTAETFTVCFFPGTLIATPHGERKVEEIVPGDPILIMDSGSVPATWAGRMARKLRRRLGFRRAAPVKWIGRQTISTRFGPAERLMPVRFSAGSLGWGGGGNPFCRIAI